MSWVSHHAIVNSPFYMFTAAFLTQSVKLSESTSIKFEIWDTVSVLLDELSMRTSDDLQRYRQDKNVRGSN